MAKKGVSTWCSPSEHNFIPLMVSREVRPASGKVTELAKCQFAVVCTKCGQARKL
jgi:hypothetical protein